MSNSQSGESRFSFDSLESIGNHCPDAVDRHHTEDERSIEIESAESINSSISSRFSEDCDNNFDTVFFTMVLRKVGSKFIFEGKGKVAEQLKHGAIVSHRNTPARRTNNSKRCTLACSEQQNFVYGQWHEDDTKMMVMERVGYFSPRHGYCVVYWKGDITKKYKAYWRDAEIQPERFDWKLAMFRDCMVTWDKNDLPRDEDMGWVDVDGIVRGVCPTSYDSFMCRATMNGNTSDDPNLRPPTDLTQELLDARNAYLDMHLSRSVPSNQENWEEVESDVEQDGTGAGAGDSETYNSDEFEWESGEDDTKVRNDKSTSPLKSCVCELMKVDAKAEHERMLQQSCMYDPNDNEGDDICNFDNDEDMVDSETEADCAFKTTMIDDCADEINDLEVAEEELAADEECRKSEPCYQDMIEMEHKRNYEEVDRTLFQNVPISAMSPRNRKSLEWLRRNQMQNNE